MRRAHRRMVGGVVGALALLSAPVPAQPPPGEPPADTPAPPPTDEPPADEPPKSPSDDATAGCLSAFSNAQKDRREGRLLQSRSALIACSQPTCPSKIVARCGPWLREVKEAIPTVVFVVRDAIGLDVSSVSVSIDGVLTTERLDGLPIEIDPGPHEIVFEPLGQAPIELQIVVVQAEKNRIVIATLPPAPKAAPNPNAPTLPKPDPIAPRDHDGGISPWAWVGFGVGAAGLIGGAIFGGLALARVDELERACGGTLCNDTRLGDFDEGTRFAHASTALFIVGGASTMFGIAALIWLGEDDTTAAVELGPQYVGLRGRF